jgi:hypothetical protein
MNYTHQISWHWKRWSSSLESEFLLNFEDEETHLWEIYKFGVFSGICIFNQTLLNNPSPSSPLASTLLSKTLKMELPEEKKKPKLIGE